jgi:pimeloyl-ACP methyl ester carboxylesterase
VRVSLPYDIAQADVEALWQRVSCPSLLVYGAESWASDPRTDGRARHFPNAQIVRVADAGHWVHHDKLDTFMALIEPFLRGEQLPTLADVS